MQRTLLLLVIKLRFSIFERFTKESALSCLHHNFSWEHFYRDQRQCCAKWRQTEQLCIK